MKKIIAILLLGVLCGFAPAVSALTDTEAANILFLKQEEKLARDVYTVLYAKWGHTTFYNISMSEQRHMDAVDGLISRYRLEDLTPDESGKFSISELQALYNELILMGSESLEDALQVGVTIEEMDIKDIQTMLDTKEKPIIRVLTNLKNGSYNHLAAFNNALAQFAVSPETTTTATCNSTCGSCQAVCTPLSKGQMRRGGR